MKKKPRKQQDVVRKEERTNTHTQTVQRCANKLAKSRKEESEREREREKMHKRVRKKNNFCTQYKNIYIYMFLLLFLFLRSRMTMCNNYFRIRIMNVGLIISRMNELTNTLYTDQHFSYILSRFLFIHAELLKD